MAADIKLKYPSTSSVAITCDVSSLASSTAYAGRASTAIDNTTNLDLDHIVSGSITLGTTPTASKNVWVYAYAPTKVVTGTPTYPDGITGTDAAKTMTSANVGLNSLVLLWSGVSDATTGRVLDMPPTSIAQKFGVMPPFYGIFVTHDTVAALNSTAGNHFFHYYRIQSQTV